MNRLPQELIDRICGYVAKIDSEKSWSLGCTWHDNLKNTLLLSHAFRFAAEKHSGEFSNHKLYEGHAQKFIDTYSGHRFRYLREIEFYSRLPRVEYVHPPARDDAEQLRKNDESFTRQIKFLFDTIKTVEESLEDQHKPGKIALTIHAPYRVIENEYSELSLFAHFSWRVHLLDAESLPCLDSIRSLEFGAIGAGYWPDEPAEDSKCLEAVKLDYRIMLDLATRCPNLEFLGCRLGGDEWTPKWELAAADYLSKDWAGPRRDSRKDFAEALKTAKLPHSLRRVRLDFLHDLQDSECIDHNTMQPDMVSPALHDPFSTGLHYLTQHLRRIQLRVVADETLFWPSSDHTSSWPNLECLVVMFHMVTPSGKWYFKGLRGQGGDMTGFKITGTDYPPLGPSDYDDEMLMVIQDEGERRDHNENSRFRIVPNDAVLRPFLAAFAKAAANMRRLREAALWCPLAWQLGDDDQWNSDWDDDSDEEARYDQEAEAVEWLDDRFRTHESLTWAINYLAPGERDYTQAEGCPSGVGQLWWRVGKWRPDPELHALFQRIGGGEGGEGLREHWRDDEYAEKLVPRYHFEGHLQEEM